MKKTFTASKFIAIISLLFFIGGPILCYLVVFIVGFLFLCDNLYFHLGVLAIGFICFSIVAIVIIFEPSIFKVTIKDGLLYNYVIDGTRNDGWPIPISKIKKAELVDKEELQKIFHHYEKGKAILIDLGNQHFKYIYVGFFSKRQIKKMLKIFNKKM